MLPRPRFPLSQAMSTNFCISHLHIRFATLPVIAHIRPLIFLFPLPRLFLFSLNLVTPTVLRLITLPLAGVPFHSTSSMQASSQEPSAIRSDDTWPNRRQFSAPRSHFTRLAS